MAEAVRRSDFLRRLGEGRPEALARSFVTVRREDGDAVVAEGGEGTAMNIVAGEGGLREPGRVAVCAPNVRGRRPLAPQPRARVCVCVAAAVHEAARTPQRDA